MLRIPLSVLAALLTVMQWLHPAVGSVILPRPFASQQDPFVVPTTPSTHVLETTWQETAFLHGSDPARSPTIQYCPRKNPEHDLVQITELKVTPDPPAKGQQFEVIARGDVQQAITEHAYVDVVIKLRRFIQILKKRFDLCEEMKKVNRACPVEPGPFEFKGTFELPKEIPNGSYTVEADAVNGDGQHITCLLAELRFTSR